MTASYRFVRALVRGLVLPWIRIEVEGLRNVPDDGPCLLLPNHQSVLDPLVVQAVVERSVATMTKSTQFSSPAFREILRRCEAFPVRRYRIDPHAVRMVLRRLEAGMAVCIYPEGERSWDGRLQPFRPGTLRVMLRAGAPVVPVGIDGMYDVWPRWRSVPRLRRRVCIRFGRPLTFGPHADRVAREAALPEAEGRLREALLELSGEGHRTDPGPAMPLWPEAPAADEVEVGPRIAGAGGSPAS